jgi:succinoglycan biosynthesis transport protein ExoP
MSYEIAVPEEDSRTFADYLDALKRRGRVSGLIALALLLLGTLGVFLLPNTYQSTAVVLIEDPEIPPGLVPTTVTTFASRQIQQINQRVMTRTNLAQIIERFDLYPQERQYLPTLLLVDRVQKDMKIDVIDVQTADDRGRQSTSTIAFRVGFAHESPAKAQQVANELVSLYLSENVRARTEQTVQTSQFLRAEAERLDREVRSIESEIAQVKADSEGSLPEFVALNMQLLQRTESELLELERQLQSVEQSRILVDAQLSQVRPMAPMMLPDGSPVMSPADQLRSLQTQLVVLEGRYNADHPSVTRMKRDIEALQTQLGLGSEVNLSETNAALTQARNDLARARETYSASHPEVLRLTREVNSLEARMAENRQANRTGGLDPDNPAYIQLQAQREQLVGESGLLRAKREELRGRLAQYENRMVRSSDVERELSALLRKQATANADYLAAREKLFSAELGQAMESQSKGERFVLVEPPDRPILPASPNRPVLMALLLVLVLATALGWPQVAESLDKSINGARALERVQGMPPIAEIPVIETAADHSQAVRVKVLALVIVPAVILIAAVAVHYTVAPLDVLWYVALRRFGL